MAAASHVSNQEPVRRMHVFGQEPCVLMELKKKTKKENKNSRRTVLVAEPVCCPNAALATGAVNSVDKAKALGLFSVRPVVIGIAQQPRRHAGPEGEDDKGQQVAHGHGATTGFVEGRTGRAVSWDIVARQPIGNGTATSGGGDVVEDDEEENGTRDMNKGVDSVDPTHGGGILQEVLLDRNLDKHVEGLFQMNDLQGVSASHIDGPFDESDGRESATELIDLKEMHRQQNEGGKRTIGGYGGKGTPSVLPVAAKPLY